MTAPVAIRRLNAADTDFARHLDHLLSWESVSDDGVNQRVLEIIQAVRERGDAALVEYTQRFDGLQVASMADLILPRERLELALTRISAEQRTVFGKGAARKLRAAGHPGGGAGFRGLDMCRPMAEDPAPGRAQLRQRQRVRTCAGA